MLTNSAVWEAGDGTSQLAAVSGLVYYMSPPLSLSAALVDPIHLVVYIAYMVSSISCFWGSKRQLTTRNAVDCLRRLFEDMDRGFWLIGKHDGLTSREWLRLCMRVREELSLTNLA